MDANTKTTNQQRMIIVDAGTKDAYAISADTILEYLANATKTYYGAHGHHKAERNEDAMKHYKTLLTEANVAIPSNEVLLAKGIFNGIGSK